MCQARARSRAQRTDAMHGTSGLGRGPARKLCMRHETAVETLGQGVHVCMGPLVSGDSSQHDYATVVVLVSPAP